MSEAAIKLDLNFGKSNQKFDSEGFAKLTRLLKEQSGINIVLSDKNKTLVSTRLAKVLKKYEVETYSEYAKILESGDPFKLSEFIMCLTTNTTEFFRENQHFTFLDSYVKSTSGPLSDIIARKELRIWCAASSTGQEIYSILMTLLNTGLLNPSQIRIKALSTDIDTKVLKVGANGKYPETHVKNIPKYFLTNYFSKVPEEPSFRVKDTLSKLVTFAPFNLLSKEYPFKYPFDFVFCRNVLIYFDRPDVNSVIHKLALTLRPGGLLFIGHSESGLVDTPLLEKVTFGVYKRVR